MKSMIKIFQKLIRGGCLLDIQKYVDLYVDIDIDIYIYMLNIINIDIYRARF